MRSKNSRDVRELLAGRSQSHTRTVRLNSFRPQRSSSGLDLVADRALGDVQLVCGPGEAHVTRGRLECPQRRDGRESSGHVSQESMVARALYGVKDRAPASGSWRGRCRRSDIRTVRPGSSPGRDDPPRLRCSEPCRSHTARIRTRSRPRLRGSASTSTMVLSSGTVWTAPVLATLTWNPSPSAWSPACASSAPRQRRFRSRIPGEVLPVDRALRQCSLALRHAVMKPAGPQ